MAEKQAAKPVRSPPKRILTSTYVLVVFFALLATVAFFQENWWGFGIDILLILTYIALAVWRWRWTGKIHRDYEMMKRFDYFNQRPTFESQGNTIILTWLYPTPEMLQWLEEVKDMKDAKNSQPKAS